MDTTARHFALPFVSVVIPMRNEARFILQCLESLKGQDYPHERFEVLVVDGQSTDGSKGVLTSFDAGKVRLRFLENPKMITSVGLNIGIRRAEGEVIVILGAHTECAPNFLTQCVRALERTDADCVGGPIRTVGRSFSAQAIAFALSCPFGVGDARFRYSQHEEYVDTVAFPAFRRGVLERIGLFDEGLVRNQDIEFSGRVRSNGGKILLTPAIRVIYYSRGSLRELCRQSAGNGYWNIHTYRRNRECLSVRHFVPLAFVGSLLATSLGAPFSQVARALLLSVMVPYGLCNFAFSLVIASREGIRYLWVMPFVFLALHTSYGLGSLWALVECFLLGKKARRGERS